MKANVLVLSAGRRVELVQEFKQTLTSIFPSAKVFSTDLNPQLSAACQVADKAFGVPRVTNESYIDCILSICLEHNVGLVIPTIDTELLLLSHHRDRFLNHGVEIIISDLGLIEDCRDKRNTARLFERLNIDAPAILNKDSLTFPCFCKPYDGSCSVGAVALQSAEDLTKDLLDNPRNMFMELVPRSFCEYTIDAYYTQLGELISLVPRKRLEVRGGEVSKGVTRKNFVYDYLKKRVSTLEGARGCITFQLFVNEMTETIKGLEVNPRFGGGYPLAFDAGANFPELLIREYLLDETLVYSNSWEDNLTMLRYDAKVLVHA